MEAVLDTVPVKVSPEMNAKLIAPYIEAEVKEALFQMFPTNSPGPDGFPAHFFQRHWDFVWFGSDNNSVESFAGRGRCEDDQ
jgi:hypothetical protein